MDTSLILSNMNFLSPDSRCYSFDHRANGYARGEGFGVLVLKRMSDAIRDGDIIRAVVRSTGSNSDGRTPGIAQPSGEAQERLIRETYAKEHLDPGVTRYFEAHGTGTAVGDPIEAGAIGAVFGQYRNSEEPLYVGAVKSNVGHLEGASGVAGVIKAVLALEKGIIPPNTNFERLNPQIDAPKLGLVFPSKAIPWPSAGLRRASVNSFGFGGSNAHVVLDDAYNFLQSQRLVGFHSTAPVPPKICEQQAESTVQSTMNGLGDTVRSHPALLVWSAADVGGLKRLSELYNAHFKAHPTTQAGYLSNLAHTLAQRRSIFPWRSYALVNSTANLQSDGVTLASPLRSSRNLGLCFVFTGQGAQFAGMGRELLAYPVFKNMLMRAQLYLYDLGCEWSLMDELRRDQDSSRVNQPDMSQPLCTALQIALIELLRTFGITPKAVVGHSSGEIAAAYCMGALSLRSACKVAFLRGKLAASLNATTERNGAMLAVGASEEQAAGYIDRVAAECGSAEIVVACVNSPSSVTISGDEKQILLMQRLVEEDALFARKLQVDVAYHSPHMQCIAEEYARQMGQLELGRPLPGCATMVSSVTTMPVTNIQELCEPSYWVRNLVSAVRFSQALGRLVAPAAATVKKLGGGRKAAATGGHNYQVYDLLELGPHSALAGPIKQILKTAGSATKEVRYASCLSRNASALETTMTAAGNLWCAGYPVDLAVVNHFEAGKVRRRTPLTDLPEYPFDHSQSYWHESRVSKEYRLRRHPHLDLLGTRSTDSNSLVSRWTKFIRPSETPWVADHVVNGATIYPAAGMLVMAIEGARQLLQESANPRPIHGYRITEATFQRALSIDTTVEQGTECQIYLTQDEDAMGKGSSSSRFEFRIYTLDNEIWAENCRGLLQVEYEATERNSVDGGLEAAKSAQALAEEWDKHAELCTETVDASMVYKHFREIGLEFGPTFQTLAKVDFSAEGQVVADINTFPWHADGEHNPRQDHLVHPTTLDSFIQTVLVGLTRGAAELIPTTVPTRITNLWLAPSGLSHPEATTLRAVSRQLSKGARQTESSFIVVDENGDLRASVGVLETTNIDHREAADADTDGDRPARKLCYHMDWKPDIDFLPGLEKDKYFGTGKAVNLETAEFYDTLACFQLITICNTLRRLDQEKVDRSRTEYIKWMKLQLDRADNAPKTAARTEWRNKIGDVEYYESLAARLEGSSSEGRFYVQVGRNLLAILHGEVDPLQVLFSGDLVKEYYLEINDRLSEAFFKTLDLMAHKNPSLRVLEVGAGTGGTTAHVIKPLFAGPSTRNRCAVYDYTDTSASFFEQARDDFSAHASRMRFSTLDIEQNPSEQGFSHGTYDVIIAANVLHATPNMDITLRNVHSLLKPGGKLVLLEQTGDFARGGFAFGLLPGWWLSQDGYRSWGPTMPPRKWDDVLQRSSFSGTDLVINDYQSPVYQELSVIVSTAKAIAEQPDKLEAPRPAISLLTMEGSAIQQEIAGGVKEKLSALGFACEISYLGGEESLADSVVISLMELDKPLLHSMDEATFNSVRSTLLCAKGLVWLTGGGGGRGDAAEYHIVDGLMRTLRTENVMLKAITMAMDVRELETTRIVEWIHMILEKLLTSEPAELEIEYQQREHTLYINRVVQANNINEHISSTIRPQNTLMQSFGAPNVPPLALQVQTPGQLDSLCFVEDLGANLPLKPNEVEIKVEAVGVNFMDLLTALGRINQVDIGGECAGIITRVGSETNFQPGDRVCAVAFDCFKTLARSDARIVMKIPDSVSFTEAAALPITFTTAHYALMVAGRLQRGDRILIHAAAGGTGQSAIQIAQYYGAEVFATVGSQSKKQFLMEEYSIPEDHIFYSRDTSFAKGVMRATSNRGMDIILNSLSGEGLVSSWACMASFGRFVEIGKRDIHSHSRLNMFHFAKNVSFTAVDVFGMAKQRPDLVRVSFAAAMELIAAGHARASRPVQVYGVSHLEAALRHMQSGKSMGKLVIEMKADESVLVRPYLQWPNETD
jgi:acyl transferase domain-containing protein/NADPH:quinone reductase-like Zn-dependent oxidoreductase/SAM-dependent methyltransferase